MKEIVAQGGIFGGIKCSNLMETIGKECLKTGENIYVYKNCVNIPPLAFVDDLFNITECGTKLVASNAYINTKIELKNLEFAIDEEKNEAKKCRHIHVGKENTFCPQLKAHNANIKKVNEEKYVGDIISSDGKLTKTIQQRTSRAVGIISQITTILKTVSLGNHYFFIAILLRNAMFISSVLINSEVWYPITKTDIEELETMDRQLIRKVLEVPESCPKELLYLETGCIPLNIIIKCIRVNFLHYLLTRKEDELLSKFFKAQLRNPSKGDWTELIKQDSIDFKISESFEEIAKLSKNVFKKKVASACKRYAFDKLISDRNNKDGSKGKDLTYTKLKTENYLINEKFSPQESKLLFKLRSRMLNVQGNFKSKYLNNDTFLQCQKCLNGLLESQQHINLI